MTKEEELKGLKQRIWSNDSLIRMMKGNTPENHLKKLEKEWNDPIRDRIAEPERELCSLTLPMLNPGELGLSTGI